MCQLKVTKSEMIPESGEKEVEEVKKVQDVEEVKVVQQLTIDVNISVGEEKCDKSSMISEALPDLDEVSVRCRQSPYMAL